jgi:hypothetical protein
VATRKQIRRRGRLSLVLGTILASVMLAAIAYADVTVSDGDGVTPVANNNMAFGSVDCGVATSKTALVAISRNGAAGSTNVFKDGSTVTISVLSVSGAGLSASIAAGSNTVVLPSNWGSLDNNTLSGSISSSVTVNSSTEGAGSGSVTYRATGVNSSNATINRDDVMNVTWNTGSCTPPDTTPPSISYTLNPAPPANGWYKSNVSLTWHVSEPETPSSLVKTGCVDQNITADQAATTYSCSATSDGGSASRVDVTIKRDATKPTISGSVSPETPNGSNGWYITAPTVTFVCNDATSGVASCVADGVSPDSASKTLGESVSPQTVGGTATDNAGNSETASVSGLKVDLSNPVVTCPSPAPVFLLKQSGAQVTAGVSDAISDAASPTASSAADTSSVGSKSVNVTGFDNAGRSTTESCGYRVAYGFAGLFEPVNKPNTLNVSKAGQSIPLKFRLTDANSDPVLDLASAKVYATTLACSLGTTTDLVEEYASGSSGLQNLGDGYYQFNWKTPTSYAKSCKWINMDLGEGAAREMLAMFQFKS